MIQRFNAMRGHEENGFTLIELLVVVVILAILSAVVVFAVRGTNDKGRAAAAATDFKTIRTAEEAFCSKFGRYATAQELVDERFLSELPTLHTVTPTGGGTCTGAGVATATGFAVGCADTQPCSTMTVGTTGDANILVATSRNRAGLAMSAPNTQVFETLTEMGPSYELLPKLATSWDFVPAATRTDAAGNPMTSPYTDPTTGQPVGTWRFHIRPGVTFHNGALLDAAAVKAGLFDMLPASGGASIKAGTNSTQVIDNTCTSAANCIVDFTPTVNNLRVPEQLVHPSFGVVAPGTLAGSNPPGSTTYQAVGTGPFKFVSYAQGTELKTTRYDGYWGTKAVLKNMAFKYYPDNTTRRLALEAGDIDFAFEVPRADIAGVKAKGFTVSTSNVGAYQAMFANLNPMPTYDCRSGPKAECHDILADLAVRKAISMAIDRQALVGAPANFAGLATLDQTVVPPLALAPHQTRITGYSTDLAGARALLDNDGWEVPTGGTIRRCTAGATPAKACETAGYGGRNLDLTLVSGFPTVVANEPLPDYLAGKLLADLGMNVAVTKNDASFVCSDPATGAGTGTAASYQGRLCTGQGDLWIEQGNQNDANPAFLPLILFYKGAGATVATGSYQYRFNPGPTFDSLLAPVLAEPNLDTARRETADALHEAVDTKAVSITLAGIYRFYSMKSTVVGFVPFPATVHVKWAGVGKVS